MAAENHTTDHFLGHEFVDVPRLRRALTHRSAGGRADSERLACIGDAILGAASTELLAERFPDATAGELTEDRKALVKKEALALLFDELELRESVVISSELTARAKAEFLEAIFGCIFLEGGYTAVRRAARAMYTDDVVSRCRGLHAQDAAAVPLNPKVQLQELVQRLWQCVPSYEVTSVGASHCPTFTATVTVLGHPEYQAQEEGRTRKEAEGHAARALLPVLLSLAPERRSTFVPTVYTMTRRGTGFSDGLYALSLARRALQQPQEAESSDAEAEPRADVGFRLNRYGMPEYPLPPAVPTAQRAQGAEPRVDEDEDGVVARRPVKRQRTEE